MALVQDGLLDGRGKTVVIAKEEVLWRSLRQERIDERTGQSPKRDNDKPIKLVSKGSVYLSCR